MLVILTCGFWGYGNWLLEEIRNHYAISMEDSLVDISNLLSSYLATNIKNGQLDISDYDKAFNRLKQKGLQASIHGIIKRTSSIESYITNHKGIVIYDSRQESHVGRDYSRWNDVFLTLKGEYGARATRLDPHDPLSSSFYVASPIIGHGNIIGVVTVIKAKQSLNDFITKGEQKIIYMIIAVLMMSILVAALFSYWLTRPIQMLINYSQLVTQGKNSRPPKLYSKEFNKLGQSLDEMRISLEGKKSVESFVQHLTHELKSPLTAIQASAELLKEDIPKDKKDLFISNIEKEALRTNKQLKDILVIASLESRSTLKNEESILLEEVFNDSKNSFLSLFAKKELEIKIVVRPKKLRILAEYSLFLQMMNGLLFNAIEFSPVGGRIMIEAFEEGRKVLIFIRDQGPGIPDFSKNRIFEKFYSLERPSTGKKSTGLGLSFVKEVVELHSGKIHLTESYGPMNGANFLITLNQ